MKAMDRIDKFKLKNISNKPKYEIFRKISMDPTIGELVFVECSWRCMGTKPKQGIDDSYLFLII